MRASIILGGLNPLDIKNEKAFVSFFTALVKKARAEVRQLKALRLSTFRAMSLEDIRSKYPDIGDRIWRSL